MELLKNVAMFTASANTFSTSSDQCLLTVSIRFLQKTKNIRKILKKFSDIRK